MTDIIYTYENQVYVNITNHCNCRCEFCIRSHQDSVGSSDNLWFETEPSLEEIKTAMDSFDFSSYSELVYCGYGEPTCAIENLISSAEYIKSKYPHIKIRLNTNGLANLHYNRNVVPELSKVVDRVSISLNAPTAEKYQKITRPKYENAFDGMINFAKLAKDAFKHTQFTVVDVISKEDIALSQKLADKIGIHLRIRKFS